MNLDLKNFGDIVNESAALRGRATLLPVGGGGDKVFPPTYAVDEKKLRSDERAGAKYAWEKRRMDGEEHHCVLLDAVQSQANRMEEALQRLWRAGKIVLPVISVAFPREYPDLNNITSLTAPHRIADALLRDSLLGENLFRHSPLGRSFITSTLADLSGLFHTCPSAIVFGLWDSTGPTGTGIRLARSVTSEIVGVGAIRGQKTAGRIDQTGIVKSAGVLYSAVDENEQWTLNAEEARLKKKKEPSEPDEPELYKKEGKPSSALLGNIAPSLDSIAGGVTIDHAQQIVVISLAGLRRLAFGGSEDDDQKARTVLAALALVAVLAATENPGYFLRSRCHLSPKLGEHLKFQRIASNGVEGSFLIELPDALRLYGEAVDALPDRLKWHRWDLSRQVDGAPAGGWSDELLNAGELIAELQPAPKLMTLIEKSRNLTAAGEAEEGDSASASGPN